MPELALTLPMFKAAKKHRFAIPALNANGNVITDAILTGAFLEKSPVVIQASQGAIKHAGQGNAERGTQVIVEMTRALLVGRPGIPAGLNLDHGSSPEQNALCFRKGFTMMMYDGSKEKLAVNIANSRQIVQMAAAVPGIAVEVEIGRIGALGDSTEPGVEIAKMKEHWTKPKELAQLAKQSGAHLFATAVGQIHGCREKMAEIDFELFGRCIQAVNEVRDPAETGFVLHGASGVPDNDIQRAIQEFGVVKINVDTMIRQAYIQTFELFQANYPDEHEGVENIDQRKPEQAGHDAVVEVVRGLMRLFGSSGKADLCWA
jgi:fructose-bisphosphate aldolase class II